MADTEWRYRAGAEEIGPITAEELCQKFASGALRLDVIVWCPAVEQWVEAGTIPGFRQAAAAAPPLVGPPPLPFPFAHKPDLYVKAARAAWIAPLVAIFVTYLTTAGASHDPTMAAPKPAAIQTFINGVMALFVLGGFLAGIVALFGVGKPRRMNVLVPAMFGVSLSGFIILGGILTLHAARTVAANSIDPARLSAEGVTSARDYAGWMGAARCPAGVIAVASLDDQSPVARQVLGQLTTPCSVMTIIVSNPKSQSGMTLEPSSVRLLSTQGTIDALPAEDVQAALRGDARSEFQNVGQPQLIAPGKKPTVCVCFIPPGLDLHQVAAVTVRINNQKITVPGRFFSADEKQKRYGKNSSAFDVLQ